MKHEKMSYIVYLDSALVDRVAHSLEVETPTWVNRGYYLLHEGQTLEGLLARVDSEAIAFQRQATYSALAEQRWGKIKFDPLVLVRVHAREVPAYPAKKGTQVWRWSGEEGQRHKKQEIAPVSPLPEVKEEEVLKEEPQRQEEEVRVEKPKRKPAAKKKKEE